MRGGRERKVGEEKGERIKRGWRGQIRKKEKAEKRVER